MIFLNGIGYDNMDKDIDNLFKEKNREILINNLKYDLDKNIDNLLGTITNIFNLEYDTAIKNIITILNDAGFNDADKYITKVISEMKLNNYNHVDELVKNKKGLVLNRIDSLKFTEEDMNEYYDLVLSSTKRLKEMLNNHFKEVFEENDIKLDMYIIDSIEDSKVELADKRVTDYLKNRLVGKLETKIHMEIMYRDNNLINKAKESYLRYMEITSKTVKE